MSWVAEFSRLPLFSEYLIKSTAVFTLALGLVLLFRRRSASLRHFVLSLSLAGLLLLPVLSYFELGWETSLLPAGKRAADVTPAAHANTLLHGTGSDGLEKGETLSPRLSSIIPPEKSVPLESAQGKLFRAGLLFKSALPLIWAAGLIVLLLRLTAGIFGAYRLTRHGETVRDFRWRVLLKRFLALLHLRRTVRLKSHREVLVPLTWGFIKPVVLIPEGHEAWTEEQRSSALVHELWHVKRADFLVMVLVRLSLAVFWFNPLSWVVFRRLKNEQEEACDERVLGTGIKPSTYAANLLFFKSTAGSRLGHFAALLGLFGFGKSAFNERLAAILKQKWTFKEVKMKTKILLSSVVILGLALIGMARPSGPPAAGNAEAAVGNLIVVQPSVLEKTYGLDTPAVQETQEHQEQSMNEEKKAQERRRQEHAQQEQMQARQEQYQAQEKQEQAQKRKEQVQEEQEQKEHKKEAIVWTIKEGEKHKYQIKIQEGDKIKTITVGKPIVIKEKDGKKVVFITPEGKEVKVLEGDPVHLEIIGDKLQLITEGKVVKLGKDGSSFYVSVDPDVDITDISEAIKLALKDIPDVNKSVAIALKDLPVTVEKTALAKPYISWVGKHDQEELREKVREIREKLKKVEEKELELRVVEEALADLEKDLERMSKEIKTIGVKLKDKPVAYTIAKKVGDAEATAEVHVDIAEGDLKDSVKVVVSKDGMFKLVYLVDAGKKGRETYEKIVARVKKDLPEGFTLDPEFDEESGRVTLKISGPGGKETPKDLVKKITESIRDERKEKKE